MPEPSAVAEVQNPACGDVLFLSLQVSDGKIIQARFQAKGCVPAIACGSLLTELVMGHSVEKAAELTAAELETAIEGVPAASHHASQLAVDALRAALGKLAK